MIDKLFSLAGKRALVTGASRGIGRALAIGLAAAGADMAIAARRIESLDATAEAIRALGRKVIPVAMDVTQIATIRAGVATAAVSLGGLDILVNNAGVEQVQPSLDVEENLWDRIVDTNLKGAFFAAQSAARLMKRNGGVILNIASLTSERGIPTAVPYAPPRRVCWARRGRLRRNGLLSGSGSTPWRPAISAPTSPRPSIRMRTGRRRCWARSRSSASANWMILSVPAFSCAPMLRAM